MTGAGTAQNAVDNNFLNQGRPDAYATRYAGCKGETGCELTVRKDIAKESAENINKLKGCWDAGDTACVAKMREQIETDRNAYTKLKIQDPMVGGAYEQSAEFYADIVDNCGGKCGWLQAALEKTLADGVNLVVYALLGGADAPKRSGGVGSTSESGPKAAGEVVPPAPVVTSGTTRTGVVRTNAADWRVLRDNWDDLGYGQILSTENRAAIAKGKTPKVDDAWVKVFPEDAGLKGERIPMHHVQGSPLTVPLPDTRHLDAHMPGGFRYNPGGPGSALPAYPPKKGAE